MVGNILQASSSKELQVSWPDRAALKLLAVSFAFPPLAYPRSIQVARLLKYINARTVLVCADESRARKDPTLEPGVEGALEKCLRVPYSVSRPRRLANAVAHRFYPPLWERWNRVPDQYGVWKRAALKAVEGYMRATHYTPDVITTFSQPVVDHLVGVELKRRLGVPWVAHFSDPWTDHPFRNCGAKARARNLDLEREVVGRADRLLFTSQESVDVIMSKYPAHWRSKARVLPQCFDPLLFPQRAEQNGHKLIVRYVGNFYASRGPAPFVRVLQALLAADAPQLRDVSFEMIGVNRPDLIENSGLKDLPAGLVSVRPPVGYRESLELMTAADGLLIIDAPADVSVFLPSKLIEYIGAGRPVFALTSEGAAARVVRQLGGWVNDPAAESAAAASLAEFLCFLRRRRQAGGGTPWGEPGVRARYEATRIAKEFMQILRELLS
ncbi:MAG TPA: hypothetical protein VNO70_14145 [Blastocatellia bacterium]|nr:hypothetical protein [Blastocatellia bacterium]